MFATVRRRRGRLESRSRLNLPRQSARKSTAPTGTENERTRTRVVRSHFLSGFEWRFNWHGYRIAFLQTVNDLLSCDTRNASTYRSPRQFVAIQGKHTYL